MFKRNLFLKPSPLLPKWRHVHPPITWGCCRTVGRFLPVRWLDVCSVVNASLYVRTSFSVTLIVEHPVKWHVLWAVIKCVQVSLCVLKQWTPGTIWLSVESPTPTHCCRDLYCTSCYAWPSPTWPEAISIRMSQARSGVWLIMTLSPFVPAKLMSPPSTRSSVGRTFCVKLTLCTPAP